MLQYVCDYCGKVKTARENWILGFAAENVGVTAARREITVVPRWEDQRAKDHSAVHFDSEACKDAYVAELFGHREEGRVETLKSVIEIPKRKKSKVVSISGSRAGRTTKTTTRAVSRTRKSSGRR